MKAIEKLISIAKQEIGYLEKASNKDLDSKTGNAGSKIIQNMPEICIRLYKDNRGATCL